MAVVNDDLILKLENFRTKVLAILKKKGIILSDDTPLNDDLVNAIDKISTTEAIVEYCNGNLEEFINDEVTYIHNYGFAYCSKLKKIKLNNVVTMGGYCFYTDTALSNIKMDNLVTMEYWCFNNTALKNIILPNLKNLNINDSNSNFANNLKLENLIIPNFTNTLTSGIINFYANLIDCGGVVWGQNSNFKLVNIKTLILRYKNLMTLPSSNCIATIEEIYVSSDLVEKYKAATNWSVYAEKIKSIEGSKYESLTWYESEDWYKEEMAVWD